MLKITLKKHLKHPQSRQEIISEFCSGKVVLDIGCVQHDMSNVDSEEWLHKNVIKVAADTLGVDYLEEAVRELANRGYKIVQGDVTKPLHIDRTFDVIVVGNLIEHLSNFEGLFDNLSRLLKPEGVILISTANPFYSEQYFFSAFKNDIIVNPEHTCWIDPVTLDQLASRFAFETVEVRWVKERWLLSSGVIFHDSRHALDIYTGKWIFQSNEAWQERCFSAICKGLAPFILSQEKLNRLRRLYKNDFGRVLFIAIKGQLFGIYWNVLKLCIPISDINRSELYISILKKRC